MGIGREGGSLRIGTRGSELGNRTWDALKGVPYFLSVRRLLVGHAARERVRGRLARIRAERRGESADCASVCRAVSHANVLGTNSPTAVVSAWRTAEASSR